ncbi:MAG: hypothetical protein VB062_11195 [Christensenella sp.]|nr:hypothetical protein [Christensenella sp.]
MQKELCRIYFFQLRLFYHVAFFRSTEKRMKCGHFRKIQPAARIPLPATQGGANAGPFRPSFRKDPTIRARIRAASIASDFLAPFCMRNAFLCAVHS